MNCAQIATWAACSAFSFADQLPQNYGQVMAKGSEQVQPFFHAMLDRGVYLAPAMYEAGRERRPHQDDIAQTLEAAKQSFAKL